MRFCGGLGNMMFQYAAYIQIKKMYKNELCLADTIWYELTSYPFELIRIFEIQLPNVASICNEKQMKMIEEFVYKFSFSNNTKYNSYLSAIRSNEDIAQLSMEIDLHEVPNMYNDIGVNCLVVDNQRGKVSLSDFFDICNKKNEVYKHENILTKINNIAPKLYIAMRTIKNKYVRKKFLYDIFHFIKPDFTEKNGLDLLRSKGDTYYNIYGDHAYCEGIRDELLEAFHFPEILDFTNTELMKKIEESNSISIHARVKDYKYGMAPFVKRKYYNKAVKYVKKHVINPIFFIFSDDITWCKENLIKLGLNDNDRIVFVEGNSGKDSFRDMQLMSLCKHNILPNSTFSWWGAYLNKNDQKIVITPYGTLPGTISF